MLLPRLRTMILAAGLGLLTLETACVCGPGPNVGGYDDPSVKDPPRSLQGVKFIESEKVAPEIAGCADGQREGFADLQRHKRIAGCLATWEGSKSLRDKPTGKTCGDDGGVVCTSPSDACATGWHVCGAGGKNDDLKKHTTANACTKEAGPGKFVAAMSHGQTEELCPPAPTADTVFPCMESGYCSEPVCCGDACQFGKCRDAVWRGQTKISLGKAEGCGSVTSERNGGVLCCFDGEGDPAGAAGDAKAPDTVPTTPTAGDPAGAGDTKAGDTKTGDAKTGDAKAATPSGPPVGVSPSLDSIRPTTTPTTNPSTTPTTGAAKGADKKGADKAGDAK